LKQLSLAATPDNIAAILELDTTLTAPEKIDSLSYTKELLQVAIPGAGIPVGGIFSLGATVAYEVGFSTTFKGIASSNYGVLGSLPNSTGASIDAVTSSNSVANGFNAPINLQPIFNLTSLTADVVVAAFSQPKLNFGVDITQIGHYAVGLVVKLPATTHPASATPPPEPLQLAPPSPANGILSSTSSPKTPPRAAPKTLS
jgi:hypothetical protein